MATAKSTNKLKYTQWTKTMRSEYTGSIDEGLLMIFWGVDTKERRDMIIAKLQKINVKLSAHEGVK